MTFEKAHSLRLERWGQTPGTRIPDPDAAEDFVNRIGIVTQFQASPEFPNLYGAYMGDPSPELFQKHDSPSGYVYSWRWALGHRQSLFYGAIVRRRPTWVSLERLPVVLAALGDPRDTEALYEAGELSADARRIAEALAENGGTLSTGELRKAAGFPTGKSYRAAYLKALEELEVRLKVSRVFSPDEDDFDAYHTLTTVRYPDAWAAARRMTREEALDRLLGAHLRHAVYAQPKILARHLDVPLADLRASLDRLVEQGIAAPASFPEIKDTCYIVCV